MQSKHCALKRKRAHCPNNTNAKHCQFCLFAYQSLVVHFFLLFLLLVYIGLYPRALKAFLSILKKLVSLHFGLTNSFTAAGWSPFICRFHLALGTRWQWNRAENMTRQGNNEKSHYTILKRHFTSWFLQDNRRFGFYDNFNGFSERFGVLNVNFDCYAILQQMNEAWKVVKIIEYFLVAFVARNQCCNL